MSRKFLTHIDLAKNELQNATIQRLASDPGSPVEGQVYYNTTSKKLRQYNGTSWVEYGTGTGGGDVTQTSNSVSVGRMKVSAGADKSITDYSGGAGLVKSDANGVVSQAVGDTDYALPATVASKAPLASPTFTGTVTVPSPVNATDAASKGYVDNAVQGLSWKQAVRVATTANITLSGAQTIDGVSVVAGDRVLVKDQSTGSANGIYVVAAGAWSRAIDTDTSAEIDSMTVYVEAGTANGDTVWTLTTNDPTLGTTSLTYAQVNGGTVPTATTVTQGKVELATQAEAESRTDSTLAVTPIGLANFGLKKTFTIGDGASTSIVVTHSLGSKDVMTQVRQVSDDAVIECDINNTSTTQTTLSFATAPASNSIRVVVIG